MTVFTKHEYGQLFTSQAYERDGVWYWATNDAPVPLDAAKGYSIPIDTVKQQAALAAHYDKVVGDYKRMQARQTAADKAEQRAQARAAHGPGVKLVDVFTGETFVT
jgi:hypothetical protein